MTYTYEQAEEFLDLMQETAGLQVLFEAHTGKRYSEATEADLGRWLYKISLALKEEG